MDYIKYNFKALIVLLSVAFICSCSLKYTLFPEERGVRKELADSRIKTISNVSYNFSFDIPLHKDGTITAEEIISLSLSKVKEVIIDFKADKENIKGIKVNGEQIPVKFKKEHIYIPKKYLIKGENFIEILFRVNDMSLNRRDDLMYTLLVPDRARTLFPCFDQPNLKATYSLSLTHPLGWDAVANGSQYFIDTLGTDRVLRKFTKTEPIPTYLFSFVCGKLFRETQSRSGMEISIYHREEAPEKTAQLKDIFNEIYFSLDWLENYTGIKYPFEKYDAIIIPGFQYGGMEHMGATLYADTRLFVDKDASLEQLMSRSSLIAHETAHMWFGDFVTMSWFDDVWVKEIFANWIASRIISPLYKEINHNLMFIDSYYPTAYSEDRTSGARAIQQHLDNLDRAGLIYSKIVYNKAPIVMEMLVKKMGYDNFRKGVQEYLNKYAYSSATWDDLIVILDRHFDKGDSGEDSSLTSDRSLQKWSDVWVKEYGRPVVNISLNDNRFSYNQSDPYNRGISWEQDINYKTFKGVGGEEFVLPNNTGFGYGLFVIDNNALPHFKYAFNNGLFNELERLTALITLYENFYVGTIETIPFLELLIDNIAREENMIVLNRALSCLRGVMTLSDFDKSYREQREIELWKIVDNKVYTANGANATDIVTSTSTAKRNSIFSTWRDIVSSPAAADILLDIWTHPSKYSELTLSERALTNISYRLAILFPMEWNEIKAIQRTRITNLDRLNEFEFIYPSTSPLPAVRDSVFNSLMQAENRTIEPWASRALANLNSSLRTDIPMSYIHRGLTVLEEVRQTGDIFFPTNWLNALLTGHRSQEAKSEIDKYLKLHPDIHPLLLPKILQASDHLQRGILSVK